MKLKRLILLLVVPLVAAMGDRPERAERGTGFTRGVIGEPSAEDPTRPGTSAGEIEVLDAGTVEPSAYMWKARPIVIFADTPDDPQFRDQLRLLMADPAPLMVRDVVIVADADPSANSIWRRTFRPEGFSVVLLDKDGQVKQRKPIPQDVRELTRAIDKFPLRRREIGRAAVLP